ncbi:siderophore-interacting protein [Subtercola boreus]|uniref:siderophore-interacting protein n=1 Tax=Subtercola boreus TaxID=120213 RepID=UPI0026C05493
MTFPTPTPTPTPSQTQRPARPQITLAVVRREQLSPHLVRIVLGGDEFDAFQANDSTDKYVKIAFAAPGELPVTRTYTVREVDPVARTLSIDFVVHGDEGLAGPWAAAAEPGDLLTFAGPGAGYAPDPAADWHLFAGDQSVLPAIASALAACPALLAASRSWR